MNSYLNLRSLFVFSQLLFLISCLGSKEKAEPEVSIEILNPHVFHIGDSVEVKLSVHLHRLQIYACGISWIDQFSSSTCPEYGGGEKATFETIYFIRLDNPRLLSGKYSIKGWAYDTRYNSMSASTTFELIGRTPQIQTILVSHSTPEGGAAVDTLDDSWGWTSFLTTAQPIHQIAVFPHRREMGVGLGHGGGWNIYSAITGSLIKHNAMGADSIVGLNATLSSGDTWLVTNNGYFKFFPRSAGSDQSIESFVGYSPLCYGNSDSQIYMSLQSNTDSSYLIKRFNSFSSQAAVSVHSTLPTTAIVDLDGNGNVLIAQQNGLATYWTNTSLFGNASSPTPYPGVDVSKVKKSYRFQDGSGILILFENALKLYNESATEMASFSLAGAQDFDVNSWTKEIYITNSTTLYKLSSTLVPQHSTPLNFVGENKCRVVLDA
jgi:hypothetical protein